MSIQMLKTATRTIKHSFRLYSGSAALGANPKVYFDIDIADKPAGRITFELFADAVPKTVQLQLSSDARRPHQCVASGREFQSSLHRRTGLRLQGVSLPQSHSSVHASRRRLHGKEDLRLVLPYDLCLTACVKSNRRATAPAANRFMETSFLMRTSS